MDGPKRRRRNRQFRPQVSAVEGRFLLTLGGVVTGALGPHGFLNNPPGFHLVRPNTPVAPFAAPLSTATFVDPSAHILNGNHVVAGQKTYVGLFATLNATTGYIKIGSGSAVLDNASVISSPNNIRQFPTN